MFTPLLAACTICFSSAAGAQTIGEWQLHGIAVVADSTFVGGGIGAGLRSGGRLRLRASTSGGSFEGSFAVRTEGILAFYLNPGRRRGPGVYGAAGATVTATMDETSEYIVVFVGVEAAPGGRRGWFVEAGLAGGVRLSAGYRLRARR